MTSAPSAIQTGNRSLDERHFIRGTLEGSSKSAFAKYRALTVGDRPFSYFLLYEILKLFLGPIPGALGLFLRGLFYPRLFGAVGRGVVFGRNLVLRHPHKMRIGDRVILDDNCLLDARGADPGSFVIGDDVIVNRGSVLHSKVGPLAIGRHCDIGAATIIVAQGGVTIEDWVGIAGGCKISGGLFELVDRSEDEVPYTRLTKGPIRIGRRSLLAMGAIVLDGVRIGESCMVGAGAVVLSDLPPNSVASARPLVVLPRTVRS